LAHDAPLGQHFCGQELVEKPHSWYSIQAISVEQQGDQIMMMKLLMSWDIKTGREQPYFEFIVREFAPGLMRLGLQPTEAWYTVYGEGPQILSGGVTNDLETMNRILSSDDWKSLRERLLSYVTNFSSKVVPASGSFQI